jgi:hypothetical protein
MTKIARFATPRFVAFALAAFATTALPYAAHAAQQQPRENLVDAAAPTALMTSKSKSSSKSTSTKSSRSTTHHKSTPTKSTTRAKSSGTQKTTVCCKGCNACRARAAKNGVRVK